MYLLNAFSFNMLSSFPVSIRAEEIAVERAGYLATGAESAIGHPDTARVFSGVLDCNVECHRVTVALVPGDIALVGQYRGPRLAEGATELPPGATIQWLKISIIPVAP